MADPISIASLAIGAAGLFVAGMTAVANMSSAYSQYRANHPRKNQTGRVTNYTAYLQGQTMTQQHVREHVAPGSFYATYIYMLPAVQHSYPNYSHHTSIPAYVVPQSYPTQQPPPWKPSFTEQYFPTCSKAVNRVLGRTSTAPHYPPLQQHIPYPEHVPRSISGPPLPAHHNPQAYGYAGWLVLAKEQQSGDTLQDTNVGMHTGRMPGYNVEMAQAHWSHFLNNSHSVNMVDSTIAVVNWSERLISMYVYDKHWKQYYRNYHVYNYDLEAFGKSFSRCQVFSGILKDSWLVGCNDELKVVEDDGQCGVKSSNCWSLLGIQGNIPGELVFVEMKRAALFGLLQCRSKEPTLLNVDMVGDERVQFVHVDTDYGNLETKRNCWFSVFSFNDHGWAGDRVLVG